MKLMQKLMKGNPVMRLGNAAGCCSYKKAVVFNKKRLKFPWQGLSLPARRRKARKGRLSRTEICEVDGGHAVFSSLRC